MGGVHLRAEMDDLIADIAELEYKLAVRRARQAVVQSELDALRYPILSVPNEVTSLVLCKAAAMSPDQWQLVVASVCRQWREVALATPELWSSVSTCKVKKPWTLFTTWLSRAGVVPVDLRIDLMGERLKQYLPRVVDLASRWRNVELFGKRCRDPLRMKKLPHPHVELSSHPQTVPHLALHGDIDLRSVLVDAFPQWRSFLLCEAHDLPRGMPLSSLGAVTTLTLRHIQPQVVLSLLPSTPAVEYLALLFDLDELMEHPDEDEITLPHVHTLYSSSRTFLDYLRLPALRHLRIGEWFPATDDDEEESEVLDNFINRSKCLIQTLYLDQIYFSGGTTVNAAASGLSGVHELTVELGPVLEESFYRIGSGFFNALAEEGILPGLQRVTLLRMPTSLQISVFRFLLRRSPKAPLSDWDEDEKSEKPAASVSSDSEEDIDEFSSEEEASSEEELDAGNEVDSEEEIASESEPEETDSGSERVVVAKLEFVCLELPRKMDKDKYDFVIKEMTKAGVEVVLRFYEEPFVEY